MAQLRLHACAIALLIAIAGCSSQSRAGFKLSHIHGMGYSPDGTTVIVAGHSVLTTFSNGKWTVPNVPQHDYMGFSPTSDGFYSSGHPASTSNLADPLGLVKSSDNGKSLVSLAFRGEADFHLMSVGFQSHTIYVMNTTPNARLQTGLYDSRDEGQTWSQSGMKGLPFKPLQIAVHPTKPDYIAVGTENGLFLSTDAGNNFVQAANVGLTTAATFRTNGEEILFGAQSLMAYNLAERRFRQVNLPEIDSKDALNVIAVHPTKPEQFAVATLAMDVYVTTDNGITWKQILKHGEPS